MEENKQLLEDCSISIEDFNSSGYSYEELEEIYKDYQSFKKELEPVAKYAIERLYEIDKDKLHSVRHRIKDEKHLIEKIIRRKTEFPEREKVTVENYKKEITDLIGVRALHLYKKDWLCIHQFINDVWKPKNKTIAYVKNGEAGEIYKKYGCEVRVKKPIDYKSIHYVISSRPCDKEYMIEIQTRTIFEEGWSEIDHKIRYPNKMKDPVLDQFLGIFNNFAENANQMGSYVKMLNDHLKEKNKLIDDLSSKIKTLDIAMEEKELLEKELVKLREEKILPFSLGDNLTTISAGSGQYDGTLKSLGPAQLNMSGCDTISANELNKLHESTKQSGGKSK
jgi:GTP pyrophosphokinase